jgi:hypothetical protein
MKDYSGTWIFLKIAVWKHEFAWLPHHCRISKRLIWLKKGYKGTATYTGPGFPVMETHWHDTGEHIKWLLCGREKEMSIIWAGWENTQIP